MRPSRKPISDPLYKDHIQEMKIKQTWSVQWRGGAPPLSPYQYAICLPYETKMPFVATALAMFLLGILIEMISQAEKKTPKRDIKK